MKKKRYVWICPCRQQEEEYYTGDAFLYDDENPKRRRCCNAILKADARPPLS